MTPEADLLHRAAGPILLPRLERRHLARLFAEWGFTRGAEIGVDKGHFSHMLCAANPALQLLCVDIWENDRHRQIAQSRLDADRCQLLRLPSLEAASTIPDATLDFVYIDADHAADACVADLEAWAPKVRAGGVVAGHDYDPSAPRYGESVVEAVQRYTTAHEIQPWFVLEGLTGGQHSFLWVKR